MISLKMNLNDYYNNINRLTGKKKVFLNKEQWGRHMVHHCSDWLCLIRALMVNHVTTRAALKDYTYTYTT